MKRIYKVENIMYAPALKTCYLYYIMLFTDDTLLHKYINVFQIIMEKKY